MKQASRPSPEIFSFEIFKPFKNRLTAGISGSRNNFNLALHTGEDLDQALSNRNKLCEILHLPFENMTVSEQVHGNRIALVGPGEMGRGHYSHKQSLSGCDALWSKQKQTLLIIFLADCIPVLLYDKSKDYIAACHAGWRGTAGTIVYHTIQMMIERGSDPADIFAGIGPGIGPCCFTVGIDVLEKLEEFPYRESCRNREQTFDLKKANRLQLEATGVPRENIETMPHCTCCGEDHFFSYRKSGGAGGRFSAFIALN